ncbi:putative GCN5-related N-acetyltransferase [Actinoplanes missouriensis 431]|uniref:Putative GCN5-related N-acetyltransferase n=1 Tax=Actinoplanes missouriensis (strain ATCC 14538 / DSM 43046 / CBS 188.64 / JCM 3121 / NBRC 102363 / NCIMB 12654 / NRRL B-3342 / UNCC 431) TaxID=512565 RepID=I0HB06_ACTM4|nr:GNAT family N-acetyltransferase [Actinoplanes missouriensis]BAL90193.1 putative GCN5-related N-acetyltransferase [Actinoplanes missouriensis 431]
MGDVLTLESVTPDNYDACVSLEVHPEQAGFVAPNVDSLARAYVWPDGEARLVCLDGTPVGFVLFHPIDEKAPERGHSIVRFMIDQRFQGRGLGRRALAAALDWIAEHQRVDTVQLSVEPDNVKALAFYRAAGFTETGEVDEGELVLRRTLR